jgi:hypothetical protein
MFTRRSKGMMVIGVSILLLFATIPFIAGLTSELTHTPFQGLIMTNAHVIPGQETKAMYISQSGWFAIRHAEQDGLDVLADSDYAFFHNLTSSEENNPIGTTILSEKTEEWMTTYLTTPNAQLTVGLEDADTDPVKISRGSSIESQPWEQNSLSDPYYYSEYELINGKFIDFMPTPSTINDYVTNAYSYPDSRIVSSTRTAASYLNYPTYIHLRTITHTVASGQTLQPYKLNLEYRSMGGIGSKLYYKITVQPEGEEETVVRTGYIYSGSSDDYHDASLSYTAPKGKSGQKMIVRFYAVPNGWPSYYVKNFVSYSKVTSGYYDSDETYSDYTYFKNSYGGYTIPFTIDTLNSYYRFAFPYFVRNTQMINIVEDIEKENGYYESQTTHSPENYVQQYDPSMYTNNLPTKEEILQQLSTSIAEKIADAEYSKHLNDEAYENIKYNIDLVLKGSEWDATSQITSDRCVAYSPIDGSKACTTGTTPAGTYSLCWCDYSSQVGYIRYTSASIFGSCTVDLDRITVTVTEENGETISTLDSLETPILEKITNHNDIRLNEKYNFYITYGETASTLYQTYDVLPYYECDVYIVSATSCAAILYPGWYEALDENTAELNQEEDIYVLSSTTRTW